MPARRLRHLGGLVALLWSLLGLSPAAAAGAAAPVDWDDWRAFDEAFIDAQGRVIDWTDKARTVSEGQAYALFFALVANDRQRFAQLLDWTEKNLAQGDLRNNLPAWLWGQREDSTWGILDPNPASDADLWIAYTLFEAARLWQLPEYRKTAQAMLAQIKAREVVLLPGGPALLLPGPQGFVGADGGVRFNPSYYVGLQLRALQLEDPQGPWGRLIADFVRLLPQIAPLGRVPDWSVWHSDRIIVDAQTGGAGSYDAIRVYLWAGFSGGPVALDADAQTWELRRSLRAFRAMTVELQRIPEHWTVGNSGISGTAPPGFVAAMLPFLQALGDESGYARAREQLEATRVSGLYGKPARYYDQVLVLFGKGYADRRYRFDANGKVIPSWQ